jgi:hypothetical protein
MNGETANSLFAHGKRVYEARVRLAHIFVLGLTLAAGGCFDPDLKNRGFACTSNDDGQCPVGYYCVGGYCQDSPGASNPGGVAVGGGSQPTDDMFAATGDLATGGDVFDMAHGAPDLGHHHGPADMAKLPPDFSKPVSNSCAHDFCTTGAALDKNCDPCVASICAAWPNCCSSSWSSKCVGDVATYCSNSEQCP